MKCWAANMKRAGGTRSEDEGEDATVPLLLEWLFTRFLLETHALYFRNMCGQSSFLAHKSICLIHANLPHYTLVFHRKCDFLFAQETSADRLQASKQKMSSGTAGSNSRLLQYYKSMNGEGNVFQQGTICWFALRVWSSHWGTEIERIYGRRRADGGEALKDKTCGRAWHKQHQSMTDRKQRKGKEARMLTYN